MIHWHSNTNDLNIQEDIILGAISMHIDNMEDQDAQMFLHSLVAFNLTQHVKIPTHNRGQILYVIITQNWKWTFSTN